MNRGVVGFQIFTIIFLIIFNFSYTSNLMGSDVGGETEFPDNHVDWKPVEEEFRSVAKGSLLKLKSSELLRDFGSRTHANLWSAMLLQSDRPLVQISGYWLISNKYPNMARAAAISVLATARRPGLIYYELLYTDIADGWEGREWEKLYLYIGPNASIINISFIVNCLPPEVVVNLIANRDESILVNPAVYALAIDRLLADDKNDTYINSAGYRKLKLIPGISQIIYLLHSIKLSESDMDLLIKIMGSDDLSDLNFQLLARKYYDLINSGSIKKGLSEKRLRIFQGIRKEKGEEKGEEKLLGEEKMGKNRCQTGPAEKVKQD